MPSSARLLRRAALASLALLIPALHACSDEPAGSPDGGTKPDAGPPDTGTACPVDTDPPDEIAVPELHTPRWAFEPWISKDISDGPDTYAFVQGFIDRDIPVGAVVLDSPWETSYNTFVPNPTRYPEFAKMVSDMHGKNVRVVLWITQLLNSVSYDLETGGDTYKGAADGLQDGRDCGFFIEDGTEYSWWKGKGASVDFMNPSATTWWHRRQDTVLDVGIDGWKLDFGDSYVNADPIKTAKGSVSHQEYSEAYYRDYLSYGVHKRGKEFLTMVRAWDASYGFAGRFYARPEHAPVSWMGDNRRDWIGMADVLDEMFRSTDAGYAVVGSDIGGYLDRDDKDLTGPQIPFDPVVFARWTALGALSPFMQLHGRANITPWDVPQANDEIVTLYRYWSKLHHELVPFFYSLSEEAQGGGPMIVRPEGPMNAYPGDYRFTLGGALLVAPILDATGKRDVALPAGAAWYDWWTPSADALPGGQTLAQYDATDIARFPLFIRSGAILPANVTDAVTGLGTPASAGRLTVLVYPDAAPSSFRLHDEDDALTTIDASRTGAAIQVKLSRALRETLLRIRADAAPATVKLGGQALTQQVDEAAFDAATSGWLFDAATRTLRVKVPVAAGAQTIDAS